MIYADHPGVLAHHFFSTAVQQAYLASHLDLIEINQATILGNIIRLQGSNIALTTWGEQLEISESAHHHSRSRHARRSDQGGDGTSGQQ